MQKMNLRVTLLLRWAMGIYFIAMAAENILGATFIVASFERIGWGEWFRYVTALCQLTGGGLLLFPASALYGAVLLSCVMVGAFVAKIMILGGNPALVIMLLLINLYIASQCSRRKTAP